MPAGESIICVDLTNDDDDSVSADAQPAQHDEATTLQQKVESDWLAATAEVSVNPPRQLMPIHNEKVTRRLLYMPLAPQRKQPSANPHRPHIPAAEGHNCLLDHVVLKDILRVLGDSLSDSISAPELYMSLQVQYLRQISDSQAEHQGRLLVYLEWLTQKLLQCGLTAKHEMLYTVVLKLCKASEVDLHLPSQLVLANEKLPCTTAVHEVRKPFSP